MFSDNERPKTRVELLQMIKAHQGFTGTLYERIHEDFTVSELIVCTLNNSGVLETGNSRRIVYPIALKDVESRVCWELFDWLCEVEEKGLRQ